MTPQEKLQECKLVLSTIDKAGLLTSTSNQLRWLIARVEQLEKLLEGQLNYLHFSADDRRYQVYIEAINDALATGPKPE